MSPSKIQRKAIPQILSGGNVVFAASTGSGKTLAYLMPLIQQLRAQEVRVCVSVCARHVTACSQQMAVLSQVSRCRSSTHPDLSCELKSQF